MARFAFSIFCAALLIGCGSESSNTPTPTTPGQPAAKVEATGDVTKLKIEDLEKGSGPALAKGDTVVLLYRGVFKDGKEFDGNMDANFTPKTDKQPFSLQVGLGQVIQGWDEGLVGAQQGTVRKLSIPWKMAYGAEGRDTIPPKADLFFYVKILNVSKAGAEPEILIKDIKEGTGAGITEKSVVVMKYTGKLLNGQVFDKRDKETMPINKFHTGLLEAVLGMKKGGVRKVTVPPNVLQTAYSLPRNQVCVFEFELLDIKQ
jgi:peptidylprolyl isomerase